MRIGKFLTMATVPMMLLACSDDNSGFSSNPSSEEPVEQPKNDSIPPNTPDSLLKPITRDFSLIWKGEGSAENPYQVASEADLISLAFYVNDSSMSFRDKHFVQTSDIALTKPWSPIGIFGTNAYGYGNRPFSGIYDGGAKSISGLTISDTARYSGLFGLTRGAQLKNVVIKGAKMDVGSYAGVLAGMTDSTVVENCNIENAEIKGNDRVAGLIGEASYVTVTNVSVTGSVTGTNSVGGVLGSVQNVTMTGLTNKATVSGKATVGGIAGASASVGDESVITNALNYGAVTGTKDVGGLFATLSNSKLEKSGNNGVVTADSSDRGSVGGAVAVVSNKSVVNEVYNAAKVTVKKLPTAGGVIGNTKSTVVVTNVFNHGELSGKANNMGGLVGLIEGDAKLQSAYNKGVIPNENYAGTVAGNFTSSTAMANVFYDKTVGGTCLVVAKYMDMQLPTGVESTEMKAAAFITQLGSAEGVWTNDPAAFDGYPIFTWMK